MVCDLCKEVHKRRAAGWAKKTIPSVASWWWLDQQDDRHGVKDFIRSSEVLLLYIEIKMHRWSTSARVASNHSSCQNGRNL